MIDSMYQEQTEKVLQDRIDRPLPERIIEPQSTWNMPSFDQAIKFASDYYGIVAIIPVIFLVLWARKRLARINLERLTITQQIALWSILTIVVTTATAIIFGEKAASYTGGSMILAAFYRIRESLPDKDE